jgi:formate hydrogenlyase subunit 3/multisubunit Na+/H+ antiporter MnhD subunit
MLWLAVSIGLCGLPYLFGFLSFFWPVYRLNTAVLAASAVATMVMASLLFWVTPYILRLQTPGEYQRELEEAARREAKAALHTAELAMRLQAALGRIVQLEEELQHLQFRLQTRETCDAQLATLSALRKDG